MARGAEPLAMAMQSVGGLLNNVDRQGAQGLSIVDLLLSKDGDPDAKKTGLLLNQTFGETGSFDLARNPRIMG